MILGSLVNRTNQGSSATSLLHPQGFVLYDKMVGRAIYNFCLTLHYSCTRVFYFL